VGICQLTNVPTAASKLEIRAIVEGENIDIVCSERNSENYIRMTSTFVGDHMLAKPEDLRRMYADDLATAIRLARDAGYRQAKAELRTWLDIPVR
jgi:hypothetical protein